MAMTCPHHAAWEARDARTVLEGICPRCATRLTIDGDRARCDCCQSAWSADNTSTLEHLPNVVSVEYTTPSGRVVAGPGHLAVVHLHQP